MSTLPSDPHRVPSSSVPTRLGLASRLLWWVPSAAVLASLGGVAYWGHTTEWKFAGVSHQADPPEASAEVTPRPFVRLPSAAGASGRTGIGARIEFPSEAATRLAGIDTTVAWSSGLTEQATAAGELAFDPTRVARLSARAGGVLRRVLKAPGDPVRAGEVVALVDSADVGTAKAEFQQALVQVRHRERVRDDLAQAKSVVPGATLQEAEAALKESEVRVLAAAQELGNLGLPVKPADFRKLPPADTADRLRSLGVEKTDADLGEVATLLPVRAPFPGVVLSADAVAGETAEVGRTLFTVVDPTRVWVTLHVAAEDARRAATGQKAFFRPDGDAREYPATVVWVGAAADEGTRTVPVRAEADNAAGTLRAATLGRGRVVFREEPKAVVLPQEAVHSVGGQAVVFVRDPAFLKPDGPKAFHVRAVTIGGRDEKNTEILSGVAAGEVVATAGGKLLLAELTRAIAVR